MPTRSRDGPFAIRYGNTLDVVVVMPSRLNASSHIASSAAITYGKPHASQPAIAAFTAANSIVASRFIGGRIPITSSVWNGVEARIPRTRSLGGREQRESIAPTVGEGELVERDGVVVDGDTFARQRVNQTPRGTAGVLGTSRQQFGAPPLRAALREGTGARARACSGGRCARPGGGRTARTPR